MASSPSYCFLKHCPNFNPWYAKNSTCKIHGSESREYKRAKATILEDRLIDDAVKQIKLAQSNAPYHDSLIIEFDLKPISGISATDESFLLARTTFINRMGSSVSLRCNAVFVKYKQESTCARMEFSWINQYDDTVELLGILSLLFFLSLFWPCFSSLCD